jgi:hypothetical protein
VRQEKLIKEKKKVQEYKHSGENKHICILMVFLTLVALSSAAYSQLTLSAELRPRTELRHGYRTLAGEDSRAAIFTSQRTRLGLLYHRDQYRLGFSVQDVRVWGDEAQLKDVPSIAAHELWGEIDLTANLHLKVGRQELVYDDHRLLGNVNWTQQARSHDAALLKYRRDNWKLDVAAAYNNEQEDLFRTAYTANNYRALFFAWVNHQSSENLKISALALADGFQGSDPGVDETFYRYTVGPHAQLIAQNVRLTGTFYYQFGTDRTGRDINAYMYAIAVQYQQRQTSFNAGVDFLSGTNASETSEVKTFNTLYATNHKFYGWMDYFLNIPQDTKGGGLRDLYAGGKYQLSPKTSISATFHQFSLTADIANPLSPGVPVDKNLGSEIDALFQYKFLPELNIQAGFSMFFPENSLEILKSGSADASQYWGWLMIRISPEILNLSPGQK